MAYYSLTVTVVKDCPESTFAQALEYVHPTSNALAGGRVYGDWLAPVRELPELGGSVLSTAVSGFFWGGKEWMLRGDHSVHGCLNASLFLRVTFVSCCYG